MRRFLVVGALLAFGTLGCGRPTDCRLTLVNRVGQPLPEVTLRAGTWKAGPFALPSGASVTQVFKGSPGTPGPYTLVVRCQGERWAAEVGFVQAGRSYQDVVEMERKGITLRSEQALPGEEAQPLRSEQSARWARIPLGNEPGVKTSNGGFK